MIVISDTSAVKALFKIDRLSILRTLFSEIIIPEAVNAELVKDGVELPGFIEVRIPKDVNEL